MLCYYRIYVSEGTDITKMARLGYCCIIAGISKSNTIDLMQNINLSEKSGTLSIIKIYFHLKNG